MAKPKRTRLMRQIDPKNCIWAVYPCAEMDNCKPRITAAKKRLAAKRRSANKTKKKSSKKETVRRR